MKTRLVPATGDAELEANINAFITNKTVYDIKFTEWVSYKDQTGGYTALITYDDVPPAKQFQVRIFAAVGEIELENQLNGFMSGREVVDVKFTEWVEYDAKTGGYTALVIYVGQPNMSGFNQMRQPVQPQQAQQFNVL